MLSNPLAQLAPTPEPLLKLGRQSITDEQLQEMARADYADDVEQHLAALQLIKHGDIPAPMEWHPREVLELTRWIEPDNPPEVAESQQIQNHWLRLFACTILVHADVNPKNFQAYHWSCDETTIQLVDSAIRLGKETSEAALRFLCWCWNREQLYEEESWFFALGILLLATALDKCETAIADYLLTFLHNDARPLLGWIKESQRKAKWTQLAQVFSIPLEAQ